MAEERERAETFRVSGITLGFVARATLVVILLLALGDMLWKGRDIFFVAFFAILVASFLSIFVELLEKVRVPRGLAAVLVLLAFVGVLTGLAIIAWPTLEEQLSTMRRQLPSAIANAGEWLQAQWRAITGEFGEPDPGVSEQIEQRFTRELGAFVSGALPLLNTVVGAVAGVLIVVFAGLFMAADPRTYVRGLALLVPKSGREQATDTLVEAGQTLRMWMLGTVISMTIVGVLTWVGLAIVGVPGSLVLGVIAGVLEFVPYVGPALSALPGLAIALLISPAKAFYALLVYAAVQALESNVIHPLVMKETVHLPPALTILWVSLMGVLFGFLGLFLAVPILAVARVAVRRLYVEEVANAG